MVITVEMTNLEQPPVSDKGESGRPAAVGLGTSNGYQPLEENSEPPMSPIDELVLEEVLYNRPSLRLGREVSMRFRAQTAVPSRRNKVYQSLPHGSKRPRTTATGGCLFVCL